MIGHALSSDLIDKTTFLFFNKNTSFVLGVPYLCSKTESIAVCESGAGVMEDTRTVYLPLEMHRCAGVLGDNNISVTATVFMYVADGIVDVRNYFYGTFECAVLGSHTFSGGWTEGQ